MGSIPTLATIFTTNIMKEFLNVMPVSVLDISKQEKRTKEKHSHNDKSSREEYSPFPKEVSMLCYEFFLKNSSHIFDPFAGWGERHYYALKYGKEYVGYDTSHIAYRNMQS